MKLVIAMIAMTLLNQLLGMYLGYRYHSTIRVMVKNVVLWAGSKLPNRCAVAECDGGEPRWHEAKLRLPETDEEFYACSRCVLRIANGQTLTYKDAPIDSNARFTYR